MSFYIILTFNILLSDFNVTFYLNSMWIQIISRKLWTCNVILHIYFSRWNFTKRPYGGLYGFISPFIQAVVKDLNLKKDRLPSKNKTIVPMIVEKAALGIIEEGKKIGKQREAEEIANQLIEKKNAGMEEVWRCCAYLYSLKSFLYKKLNETMRLIGSEEHEQIWRSKIRTFGPFCLLLWDNPFNSKIITSETKLYRGAQLSDDLINLEQAAVTGFVLA